MMLNIFRAIFVLIILAVLFVNLNTITTSESEQITSQDHRATNFWAVAFSGLGLAVLVFVVYIFAPNKELGALAGVFFGLLIGMLII